MLDHANAPPPDRHLDPWNPAQTGCRYPGALIMDRPAVYSPSENAVYNVMLDEWELVDETTIEATFSDEYTWHDGDDFRAEDYVLEQQIELAIARLQQDEDDESEPHAAITRIETVDGRMARIHMHRPFAPVFAMQNTLAEYHGDIGRAAFTKRDDDRWRDWHDRLRSGDGRDARRALEEISQANYPNLATDDPVGHGPFRIAEVREDAIVCERYEDHPHADSIDCEEFVLRYFSTSGESFQPFAGEDFEPFAGGAVDATATGFPVPDEFRDLLPDTTELYREARSANDLFAFNCGHESETETPVSDRRVRKAICHVFDREAVRPRLNGVKRLFEWPSCRAPGKVLERGEHAVADWVREFERYGENDTERAAAYLTDAGFERDDDGAWLTPDGERFELTILNGDKRADFAVLRENLEDFGVAVTMERVDSATFDDRRMSGDYEIIPDGSSANGIVAMWLPGLVVDWLGDLAHFDPVADVPMPVGDPHAANGAKTINVRDHIHLWQTTGDERYYRELVWWWNQIVPEHENMYEPDAGAFNTELWSFDAAPGVKNGVDDALFVATKLPDQGITYTGR